MNSIISRLFMFVCVQPLVHAAEVNIISVNFTELTTEGSHYRKDVGAPSRTECVVQCAKDVNCMAMLYSGFNRTCAYYTAQQLHLKPGLSKQELFFLRSNEGLPTACYSFTQRDRALMKTGKSEKEVCLSYPNHVWTGPGGNKLFSTACQSCHCCQFGKGCYHTWFEYTGTWGMTEQGDTCNAWNDDDLHHNEKYRKDKQFPADGTRDNAENYCRDPDRDAGELWCYTTDKVVKWQYCGIRSCSSTGALDCYVGYTGNYSGTLSWTQNNHACQRWDEQTLHQRFYSNKYFPRDDFSVVAANNYCRDPANGTYTWCWTDTPGVDWERCNIKKCD